MDNFKWTDELVREYAMWVSLDVREGKINSYCGINDFKNKKIIDKEWEILTIKYGGNIFYNFFTDPIPSDYTIYSVRRLSDGEVFTIGDTVMYGLACSIKPIEWPIDNFFIKEGDTDILVRSKDNEMVEYLGTLKKVNAIKLPLGLMPEFIWKEKRVEEIDQAIMRYIKSGKEVPIEWIREHYMLEVDIKSKNKPPSQLSVALKWLQNRLYVVCFVILFS